MNTLEAAVTDALTRLGDADEKVWSRAEIRLYLQDGYDEFCRRTKCLFDLWVIENLPPVANWQTDLERSIALQKPGWGLTDEPFHFTAENERNLGVAGGIGGTYSGPSGMTSPSDRTYDSDMDDVPTNVSGARLPDGIVEVTRVAFNERTLTGQSSMYMRQIDPNYENREGDPQFYTFDKDGLNYIRLIPKADGGAVYDTVDGSWGTMTQTSDTDVTVVTTEVGGYNTGGFGILRWRSDMFPAQGQWGTPTRVHPTTDNVSVEVSRLGRDWTHYPSELPLAYEKYVLYWAMGRALNRDGSGQDIKLAEHFEQRFEMGVSRMRTKKNEMVPEMENRFGQGDVAEPFGLGEPQLPYPYSVSR